MSRLSEDSGYSSDDASTSDDESSERESSPESISQDVLDSLLTAAREKLATNRKQKQSDNPIPLEDDVIIVEKTTSLPTLDPGSLVPRAYFDSDGHQSQRVQDNKIPEAVEAGPSAPHPPLNTALTKKQRKEKLKEAKASGWFDIPTPSEAERSGLYREVEALRLRNQLDPKRFYRKDASEGKGLKGLPKQFAIGTIMVSDKPFGGASEDNLPKNQRKRTLVDELVGDEDAKRYAKRKFRDLQGVRGERGKGTKARKFSSRKRKW